MLKKSIVQIMSTSIILITMQVSCAEHADTWTMRPYEQAKDEIFIKNVIDSNNRILKSSEAEIKARFGNDYQKSMLLPEPGLFGQSMYEKEDVENDFVRKNLVENSFVLEFNGKTVAIVTCCSNSDDSEDKEVEVHLFVPVTTKSVFSIILKEGLSRLISIKKQDPSVAGMTFSLDIYLDDVLFGEFGLTSGWDFDDVYFNTVREILKELGFHFLASREISIFLLACRPEDASVLEAYEASQESII